MALKIEPKFEYRFTVILDDSVHIERTGRFHTKEQAVSAAQELSRGFTETQKGSDDFTVHAAPSIYSVLAERINVPQETVEPVAAPDISQGIPTGSSKA